MNDVLVINGNIEYLYSSYEGKNLIVNGSVHLDRNVFPFECNFLCVTGDFVISNPQFNTMKGCPMYVGGSFVWSNEKSNPKYRLTSFKHSPIYVGDSCSFYSIDARTMASSNLEYVRMLKLGDMRNFVSLKGSPNCANYLYMRNMPKLKCFDGLPKSITELVIYDIPNIFYLGSNVPKHCKVICGNCNELGKYDVSFHNSEVYKVNTDEQNARNDKMKSIVKSKVILKIKEEYGVDVTDYVR